MRALAELIYSFLLLLALAWVVREGYIYAKAYESASIKSASLMDSATIAKYKIKELASLLTFGVVENDIKQKLDTLRDEAKEAKVKSKERVTIFAILVLVILLSYFWLSLRVYTGLLSFSALIALISGLITPILMIIVHKNIEYFGDVVLSFESKSIIGSIEKLYTNGSIPIAIAILLFSVIIPTIKTLSLLYISLFENRKFAKRVVLFFKHLGKWSMLDVFIVALLLVFFTSYSGDVSKAEAEIGVYLFLAYVILSMLASLSADRLLRGYKEE